ncbi:MAG: hypothetical protein V7784_06630 [Oceanospirillaceae bacterium]
MSIEVNPPPENIPIIWGDYNAIGLSGESDDNCIYSLHREALSGFKAEEGKAFFVYEDDLDDNDQPEIFGYVCKLEKVAWATGNCSASPAGFDQSPRFTTTLLVK